MNRAGLLLITALFLSCIQRGAGFYKTLNGESAVFYQILIDRFCDGDRTNNYLADRTNPYGYHGGDLKGILDKADYLRDLGVNVVLVSPVVDNISFFVDYNHYHHYGYHGYWPEDFDKIEENFGDFRLLSRVVSELRQRRILYVQDIVLNHAGYKSRWVENPLWVRSLKYGSCEQGNDLRMCLFGLPDFKTEREDVRRFLISKYRQLYQRVHFDGLRIDAIKHIDSLLSVALISELKKLSPDMVFIGEYWGSAPKPEDIGLFERYHVDFLYDFEFRDYVSAFLRKKMRDEVMVKYLNNRYEYVERGFLVFLNNHDLDGLITHFEDVDDIVRGKLYRIMAAMQFLCGGIPLIYFGEENGIYIGKGVENRRDMEFEEKVGGLRGFYRELIRLKRSGLIRGRFSSEMRDGLLLLRIEKTNGLIMAIINREDKVLNIRVVDQNIDVQPLEVVVIEVVDNKLNYIIPR